MAKAWAIFGSVSSLTIAAVLVGAILLDPSDWPAQIRDFTERQGVADTGAINLVSSIYLGYRAYDTLGETIVLLLGVLGTLGLVHVGEQFTGGAVRKSLRTDFLNVASGKLGPIVLVFGFYVMFFGHVSPGGGFQGGVVFASGLVFLAMGSRDAVYSPLVRSSFLHRLEGLAFLLLLLAAIIGVFTNVGLFGNLARQLGLPPAYFIVLLNILIGLKVGSSLGLLCLILLEKAR